MAVAHFLVEREERLANLQRSIEVGNVEYEALWVNEAHTYGMCRNMMN